MIEIYDRTQFSVFILEIPRLKGKELREAVRFKMVGMYPETPADENIHIIKNGKKKWSYLVFILDHAEKGLLPLSTLFMQRYFSKKDASVLYIDKNWVEYAGIEHGCVVQNTVRQRNDERLFEDISLQFGNKTKNITVFGDEKDRVLFLNRQDNYTYSFHNLNHESRNTSVHNYALNRHMSPLVQRFRIMSIMTIAISLTAFSFIIYRNHSQEREKRTQEQREHEYNRLDEEKRKKELDLLTERMAMYQELTANKTPNPSEMAFIISECLDNVTIIKSITFNEGFFQIDGSNRNALLLLQNLEKNGRVREARLHQVHPENGREAFSLSGIIIPYIETVNTMTNIKEQIAALEVLIEREKNVKEPMSPSEFGDAVTGILLKWKCLVNAFQYLAGGETITEIEYTLRGTSANFFNFLREISDHAAWEIPMMQIRNLYPMNSLDVVFRIRTTYNPPANMALMTGNHDMPDPYPVEHITRNYYAGPVFNTVRIQPVESQTTPPINTPQRMERAPWLEYIGLVKREDNESMLYVKDTRADSIIRLILSDSGDMRYHITGNGTITAYIDGRIYEISKK
jgi:hypothetical protein